jgi:hypothetical protein
MSNPPLAGSSRTTGGILRGKAHGNTYNIGDLKELADDSLGQALGKVLVYRPGQDPLVHKPQMTLKAKVGGKLRPVMDELAARYSPIKSKSIHPFSPIKFNSNLEHNY